MTISRDGPALAAHLVAFRGSGTVGGVVLCHGLPTGPRGAAASAATFPELAERIAGEVGCTALSFNCRGTGLSEGEFSVEGWIDDIRTAVGFVDERPEVHGVWLVGIAEGGTLALCAADHDDRVRGVATLAAPLSLHEWARDPGRFFDYARRAGLVKSEESSATGLARSLQSLDAERCGRHVAPRPVLILHGSDDDAVPIADARKIADATGGALSVVQAAGHELRHDPRAVAGLLGWLDRQL